MINNVKSIWCPSTQEMQLPSVLSHTSPKQLPLHLDWQLCPYVPLLQVVLHGAVFCHPGSHPSSQLPVMWLQTLESRQAPQSSEQALPYFPASHFVLHLIPVYPTAQDRQLPSILLHTSPSKQCLVFYSHVTYNQQHSLVDMSHYHGDKLYFCNSVHMLHCNSFHMTLSDILTKKEARLCITYRWEKGMHTQKYR